MCAYSQAVWEPPVAPGADSAATRGAYTCQLLTPEMLVPKLFGEWGAALFVFHQQHSRA